MNKNAFLDLDGTLVDSRNRIHRLFCELAGTERLGFDEYWNLKRDGVKQKELLEKTLGFDSGHSADFERRWLEQIEDEDRLREDLPFPNSSWLLKELAGSYSIYIVTGRQYADRARTQLDAFGWTPWFKELKATGLTQSKEVLMRSGGDISPDDLVIGDGGEELRAAKALGLRCIAVTWGFNSYDRLLAYQPDMIVNDMHAVAAAVLS